ncbi:MAG: hypothetical protein NUW24_13080 [Anaerolineae bacterium]|nr:hypothetical protein [Anaerolineae bacterium]MDH7475050.1 hypothetical protein [Anaerolineae bacterium]
MRKRWGISRTAPLGILLALTGYWGAWVDHKTAALVLSGLDMGEYAKFLPEVREGSLVVLRELFYLPPLAAALCLALLVGWLWSRYSLMARVLMLGLAVGLCLVVLPPYPFVLHALSSAEFRGQFILSVLCLLGVAAAPLYHRLSDRVAQLLLTMLACLGPLPAIAQFCAIRPALERAYGWPLPIGWGLWVMVVGFAFVIAATIRDEVRRATHFRSASHVAPK